MKMTEDRLKWLYQALGGAEEIVKEELQQAYQSQLDGLLEYLTWIQAFRRDADTDLRALLPDASIPDYDGFSFGKIVTDDIDK